MKLSSRQRAFLLNEQILGPIAINFLLNALGVWIEFRHFAPTPMWTLPGVALDVVGALPGLPFIICLITTPIVKSMVRKKKVAPLEFGPGAYPILRSLPAHNFWRASALGITSLLVLGPPLVLALLALGLEQLDLWSFVMFKGLLCAALAAVVSPIAALYALAQAGESAPALELTATVHGDPAYAPVSATPEQLS